MTLVTALHGEKSVWLCTDRRLTYPTRARDDGCKVLQIAGTDGEALLGYAGLGASQGRTQPSAWMNDVLKDQHGLTIENQLGLIAQAMQTDMPRQLESMYGPQAHHLLATAIVNNEPRLYGVSLELQDVGIAPKFIYTRFARTETGGPPPRLAFAGSGATHLPKGKTWARDIFRVVRAVEAGRVNPMAVADRLAALNAQISGKDPFVSPGCIVTWRLNGGGFQFFEGVKRVSQDIGLPAMANGMDVREIADMMAPLALKSFEAMKAGQPADLDAAAIQAGIDKINKRAKRKL